jgi:hypothetical protein
VKVESVIDLLSRNALSLIVFDRQGGVNEVRAWRGVVTGDAVKRLGRELRGSVFRFAPRGVYSRADLERMQREAVEAADLAQKGELRPGANSFEET